MVATKSRRTTGLARKTPAAAETEVQCLVLSWRELLHHQWEGPPGCRYSVAATHTIATGLRAKRAWGAAKTGKGTWNLDGGLNGGLGTAEEPKRGKARLDEANRDIPSLHKARSLAEISFCCVNCCVWRRRGTTWLAVNCALQHAGDQKCRWPLARTEGNPGGGAAQKTEATERLGLEQRS